MEDIAIKDTDSAPKFLGLELAFDNGWDKPKLARIRKMGTEWADKIRKAVTCQLITTGKAVCSTNLS